MQLFDSHSHPHFVAYKDDSDEVIRRALDKGIGMLVVGTKFDTSQASIACAEKYDNVWAAVGLHPIHLSEGYYDPNEEGSAPAPAFTRTAEVFEKEKWKVLAMSSPKVVAIGETGLDYYRLEGSDEEKAKTKDLQRVAFREQAMLAAELDKALVVHCREAHAGVLEVLTDVKKIQPTLRGVIHCFTGTPEEGRRYLEFGFYLSFPGIVTFAKDWDVFLPMVPRDQILIETDCPYLTPKPNRGKRNEPAFVEFTARHIANLRGESFEDFAEATTENARRLFRI